MKRRLCWLLLAALALGTLTDAFAESTDGQRTCYAAKDERYYHFDAACGGEAPGRYPLTREAAEAFDKLPCPTCVPARDDEPPLDVAVRAGTWVFRAPKASLDAVALDLPVAEAAPDGLVRLYGEALSDAAAARVAVPLDDALLMNLRVVDGDACFIVRPASAYDAAHPLMWRVVTLGKDFFGDAAPTVSARSAAMRFIPGTIDENYATVFNAEFDGGSVAVYRSMELNIAVIYLDGVESRALTGVLRVGVLPQEIPVSGYLSGARGVFCCVLTDAELGALVAGAALAYEPVAVDETPEVREDAGPGEFQPVATLAPEEDALPEGWRDAAESD